jgi:uncharacterized protein (DUF488 family)
LIELSIFGLPNLHERIADSQAATRGAAPKLSPLLQPMMTVPAQKPKAIPLVYTIGHSTRPITEFLALLEQVSVGMLVDVRSIPRSRTNPQFNADALPEALSVAGISYRHIPALGGLRHHKKGSAPSLNTFWRVAAFRNYADYAATEVFQTGLDELLALSRDNCCAVMCAEAVWWRCHRRIIADYLLTQGVPVMHIMGLNKIDPATLTVGARALPDGTLEYPAVDLAQSQ